jgi:hypothetical protein
VYTNGDSWTYGSELKDKTKAWPLLVAESLGHELCNSSFPGGSNERIVRTTVHDCLKFVQEGRRPLVLIAWTQLHRFELPMANSNGENYFSFCNPNDTDTPAIGKEIWKSWSTDSSDLSRWRQQQLLLSAFLKDLGIPYHFFITFHSIGYFHLGCLHQPSLQTTVMYHNLAFDMLTQALPRGKYNHPLEQGHQAIADYVLAKIGSAEEQ